MADPTKPTAMPMNNNANGADRYKAPYPRAIARITRPPAIIVSKLDRFSANCNLVAYVSVIKRKIMPL